MAKNSIRDFSATAGSNTDIQSVNIDENCPASGINNAIRELMVDLKNVSTGAVNLETPAADRLDVDNIRIDGNTISSTDTNGDITLDPNGTGKTVIQGGDSNYFFAMKGGTYGLRYNSNTSSSQMMIEAVDDTLAASHEPLFIGGSTVSLGIAGSEKVKVDASGNVGVGVTPETKLHVEGAVSGLNDGNVMHIESNGAGGNRGINIGQEGDGSQARMFLQGYHSQSVTNYWDLLINPFGGKVGIGTTSPSYLLHADGFIGGKAVEIGRTGGAGHAGGSHFYLGSDLEDPNGPTFTNANYRFFANRTGSVLAMNSSGGGYFYEGTNDDSSSASRKFGVETDGDVRNTNNSYGSLSDQSIKQDIADASSQWEDIKNLQVRKFRLIADVEADADAPYHLGLVAQEVETVSPGLVKVEIQRDALKDADGNPILDDDGELQMQETGELKAVKYSILYMKAVKALQEAITKIETLETEMTALKARVTALEA